MSELNFSTDELKFVYAALHTSPRMWKEDKRMVRDLEKRILSELEKRKDDELIDGIIRKRMRAIGLPV
jgi:hypothetical protein